VSAALTTADLAKPQVDTPSRRILSPQEITFKLSELEDSPFRLSPAGEARAKELRDQLAEVSMKAAVDRKALLDVINAVGPEIEALTDSALAHLEAYIEDREELLEKRRIFDQAWQAARNTGIEVGPRPRRAPPISLQHRATRIHNLPWYV
jgi:hypothetical protein